MATITQRRLDALRSEYFRLRKRQAIKSVYLLETDTLRDDRLEPIGVFASEAEARAAIPAKATESLITKLTIGRVYDTGIGEAIHKHLTK